MFICSISSFYWMPGTVDQSFWLSCSVDSTFSQKSRATTYIPQYTSGSATGTVKESRTGAPQEWRCPRALRGPTDLSLTQGCPSRQQFCAMVVSWPNLPSVLYLCSSSKVPSNLSPFLPPPIRGANTLFPLKGQEVIKSATFPWRTILMGL